MEKTPRVQLLRRVLTTQHTESMRAAVTVELTTPADASGVVHLIVSDTGVGIPADWLDSIFDPFVQLGRGLNSGPGQEGTGLGITGADARAIQTMARAPSRSLQSSAGPAFQEVPDNGDHGDDQDEVNQPTHQGKDEETERPENQENNGDGEKHFASRVWRSHQATQTGK